MSMKVPPVTNSQAGKRLVNILARGAISLCKQHPDVFPLPQTIKEFEVGIMSYSRQTGVQAGVAFLVDRQAHRDFYELLGINPDYAGRPYDELFKIAANDENLTRGLQLVSAFATSKDPSKREEVLRRNAQVFRTFGGPDFEDIAVAFERGDCQYRLVFEEMQRLLSEQR